MENIGDILLRRSMMKNKSWWIAMFGMVLMTCIVYWYIDYRRSLIPRCLGWVDYETATKVDPDIVTWRGVARDWEFVPYSTTQKLCEYLSVKTDGKVVATYHRKIKRIVPYSFHEAYGTIVFEDVDDDKIYIYSYDKRYSPSFE